jgi:uncharacterized membrane protein YfcA
MSLWWLGYPLLGAFAGFVAGLFGVGGGLTIVPLLLMLFRHRISRSNIPCTWH